MPEQIEALDHLETLIEEVVDGDVTMTMSELINLIAQPIAYDRFCCRLP